MKNVSNWKPIEIFKWFRFWGIWHSCQEGTAVLYMHYVQWCPSVPECTHHVKESHHTHCRQLGYINSLGITRKMISAGRDKTKGTFSLYLVLPYLSCVILSARFQSSLFNFTDYGNSEYKYQTNMSQDMVFKLYITEGNL